MLHDDWDSNCLISSVRSFNNVLLGTNTLITTSIANPSLRTLLDTGYPTANPKLAFSSVHEIWNPYTSDSINHASTSLCVYSFNKPTIQIDSNPQSQPRGYNNSSQGYFLTKVMAASDSHSLVNNSCLRSGPAQAIIDTYSHDHLNVISSGFPVFTANSHVNTQSLYSFLKSSSEIIYEDYYSLAYKVEQQWCKFIQSANLYILYEIDILRAKLKGHEILLIKLKEYLGVLKYIIRATFTFNFKFHYRKIIRFLFKNLGDQSGSDDEFANVFPRYNVALICHQSNNCHYEKRKRSIR